MKRFSIGALACVVAVPLVGGCGVFNFLLGGIIDTETGSSKLIPFASEAELASYLSGEIQRRNAVLTRVDRDFMSTEDVALDTGAPPTAAPGEGATGGNDAADGADQSTNGGGDFSGTTIQEVGVDESDVVKTDGHYMYMVDDSTVEGSVLRIVDVSGATPFQVLSETVLTGWGREIYLYDNKVIALTSTGGGFIAMPFAGEPMPVDVLRDGETGSGTVDDEAGQSEPGAPDEPPPDGDTPDVDNADMIAPEYQFERPKTVVTIFDVSDPSAPVQRSATAFEGTQSSSRFIDGVLHLVVSNYQSYYYNVFPALGSPELDATIEDTTTVLPRFERVAEDGTETSGNVVTWDTMYRPEDPDGFGVVSVISLDVDDDAAFTSVGIAAEPGLVYSSTQALYLTDTEYNFNGVQRETTDIYKFSYVGRGAEAAATGSVPGRVLNQYSMSEHKGNLRIASTISGTFGIFGPVRQSSNDVYVLGQNDLALEVVGSVTGLAPGETIQSARFVGDRGFIVTFLQIDPLFTLDLADPTNPRVVGELKVPGFSTFIVPMDENHLLTVGQYIPPPGEFGAWAVQLSIYDITDFANPAVMSNVILGQDTGAYSEAISNPKAFTYYAEHDMVALPLSLFEGFFLEDMDVTGPVDTGTSTGGDAGEASQVIDPELPPDEPGDAPIDSIEPWVPDGFEGVVVFRATVEDGLQEMGRISTRYPDAGIYWSSYTRGVFIGDDILAVTNKGMRRAVATDTETITDEIVFE